MPRALAGITISPDGRTVIAVDDIEPTLFLIDVAGGKVDATVRLEGVAEAAQIARFSPDNKVLAVTSLKSNTVSLIDPSFRQQVAVKVGDQPMDMAFRGNELFVACREMDPCTLSTSRSVATSAISRPGRVGVRRLFLIAYGGKPRE